MFLLIFTFKEKGFKLRFEQNGKSLARFIKLFCCNKLVRSTEDIHILVSISCQHRLGLHSCCKMWPYMQILEDSAYLFVCYDKHSSLWNDATIHGKTTLKLTA
jgi:hypothetical protein